MSSVEDEEGAELIDCSLQVAIVCICSLTALRVNNVKSKEGAKTIALLALPLAREERRARCRPTGFGIKVKRSSARIMQGSGEREENLNYYRAS